MLHFGASFPCIYSVQRPSPMLTTLRSVSAATRCLCILARGCATTISSGWRFSHGYRRTRRPLVSQWRRRHLITAVRALAVSRNSARRGSQCNCGDRNAVPTSENVSSDSPLGKKRGSSHEQGLVRRFGLTRLVRTPRLPCLSARTSSAVIT